jgi:hypothetical protein
MKEKSTCKTICSGVRERLDKERGNEIKKKKRKCKAKETYTHK